MSQVLYQQREFPVFQNKTYNSAQEARDCVKGDIVLIQDPHTGIVCNSAFDASLMVYDEDYQNEQGLSSAFQDHLDQVAEIVAKTLGKTSLVEVGCGKGYFLERLIGQGFDVTGFDPAYEGNNPRIRCEAFSPGIIDQATGLILRHVLEHIQNPIDFLRSIAIANGGSGRIYIEVPCLDWIIARRAWFDIFYEHVNYFRISDFSRWFGKVIEAGHLFGGQYLYAVVDLSSLRTEALTAEPVTLPSDFTFSAPALSHDVIGPRVIWGGSSKGVIFSLLMARASLPIDIIIDINPAKQGRFVASTGLRISSPEEALPQLPEGTPIYIMNSNYREEICRMTQDRYTYIGIEHE
ncbi:class I SAM-dependent methyltransferase [Orrella sp. 11846]|uniref:class I SAM-dependent methyltransferase n=1 Tax=Orrella sp. 11846 TaxID=3409913 RepID=UPI003B5B3300